MIFLYTGYKHYLDDNISWRNGNQMIKTILFDHQSNKWKVKSGSEKEKNYDPILRRKTWIEENFEMNDENPKNETM